MVLCVMVCCVNFRSSIYDDDVLLRSHFSHIISYYSGRIYILCNRAMTWRRAVVVDFKQFLLADYNCTEMRFCDL